MLKETNIKEQIFETHKEKQWMVIKQCNRNNSPCLFFSVFICTIALLNQAKTDTPKHVHTKIQHTLSLSPSHNNTPTPTLSNQSSSLEIIFWYLCWQSVLCECVKAIQVAECEDVIKIYSIISYVLLKCDEFEKFKLLLCNYYCPF